MAKRKHKAPGKSHRKGMTIMELFDRFPNDEAAEEWFESTRWGIRRESLCCPRCGSVRVNPTETRKPMPYWCGDCRRHFSVRIGSAMERSKIGYQKWAIAIYMWTTSLKGVSSMKLHRELGITQKSAYFMAQRLREAWPSREHKMEGPLEVDETFMGGKEKNKHEDKRSHTRGPSGKTVVVGMKDRRTNKVIAKPVPERTKEELHGFIREAVSPNAKVYTDDHRSYIGLPYDHESVNHSVGEYVRDQAHTNGVESFWALLKRGYYGTFHHISPNHLHRYVNEFANRHNLRNKDTEDMMQEMFASLIGKRLMYKELIAK